MVLKSSHVYFYSPLLSPMYRRVKRAVLKRVYAGEGVCCPLCEWEARRWVRDPQIGWCPSCGAVPRQRLMWLVLQQRREELPNPCRVLYCAPDESLENRLRSLPGVRCTTTDLSLPTVDVKADLTRLPLPDGGYHLVICSHVLEHVPNDKAAMQELFRVLAPGGEALIQVPYHQEMAHTDEDPTVVDPEERRRRYGQFDHVRNYGRDIEQRLRSAGFAVHAEHPVRQLSPEVARRHGLWDDVIFRCVKETDVGLRASG